MDGLQSLLVYIEMGIYRQALGLSTMGSAVLMMYDLTHGMGRERQGRIWIWQQQGVGWVGSGTWSSMWKGGRCVILRYHEFHNNRAHVDSLTC